MEELLLDIIDRIRTRGSLGPEEVARLVQRRNHGYSDGCTHVSKRGLLPFYLKTKRNDPARWRSWNVTSELERELLAAIQMKPRRTASGVATITVITKPWPCASACLYCPNDVRMPKSYLANEPACQRAEHNFFDPYLQVVSRVRALAAMGHPIDKVELIVLGGTWTDYPENYQIWFVRELFRALNDEDAESHAAARREKLRAFGLENDPGILARATRAAQARVDAGEETYNDAVASLYDASDAWRAAGRVQTATLQELESEQRRNETARRRVVGLVVETRPDAIDARSLTLARRLGCTKIQIGIQSLDGRVLEANDRQVDLNSIEHAFELMRAFGFKLHTHFMVNLYGQTPESDKRDYREFVTNPAFLPDEVKLYPCALVAGTGLVDLYEAGLWRPYGEDELLDILVADVLASAPYTRISRMIRDISADDILVGNKKTNLRQMVESEIEACGRASDVAEIRFREMGTARIDADALELEIIPYETTNTSERFLQWKTPDGRIAGFLRLSMPHQEYVAAHADELPVHLGEAMVREVHVYGKAARLHASSDGAQHLGLGKRLIEEAARIARDEGFSHLNVISAIGTRAYYRSLGFEDAELYQQRTL